MRTRIAIAHRVAHDVRNQSVLHRVERRGALKGDVTGRRSLVFCIMDDFISGAGGFDASTFSGITILAKPRWEPFGKCILRIVAKRNSALFLSRHGKADVDDATNHSPLADRSAVHLFWIVGDPLQYGERQGKYDKVPSSVG